MHNFTWYIKRELLAFYPHGKLSTAAAVSALLSTSGTVGAEEFSFVSEDERIAEYFLRLTEQYGVTMQLKEATRDPKRKKDKLTFFCGGEDARRILSQTARLKERTARNKDAALTFLRAACLGGGSCTLPRNGTKTGYHLEVAFNSESAAKDFLCFLSRFQLLGKQLRRGEKHVVYLKSRESLGDFLSVVGAESALKRLEEVSAEREESNHENRLTNCFARNADHSAIASAGQVVAIRELEKRGILAKLSEPLRATAYARLEYTTLSFSELAEKLGTSKSCLNHRLRKLMQIYNAETENRT